LPGKLFLVATPIGNLGDLSQRLKTILTESDLVLAEDTRVTRKILNHLGIERRLISCHDHNESHRIELIDKAAQENQSVALVSDAGTPLISDPGFEIVRAAIEAHMTIVPIPGPSACLLALIASGLPTDRFIFEGFLPDKPNALLQRLQELRTEPRTIVIYVSPHKMEKTLLKVLDTLGNRKVSLAREMTKFHEEFLRGDVSSVLENVRKRTILGECTLVIAGATPEEQTSTPEKEDLAAINAEIQKMLAQGRGVKEISQECAKKFGWKRSTIYKLAVGESKGNR
jgi:16S rRNA (cytidine1402-2'-O)-methyltransferase